MLNYLGLLRFGDQQFFNIFCKNDSNIFRKMLRFLDQNLEEILLTK